MDIDEKDIPQHWLGEDEEDSLNGIWEKLSSAGMPVGGDHEGYADVQQRIRGKLRIRRFYRLATIGSVAAAVAVCFLLFRSPETLAPSAVYAQLQEMGVDVSAQKVVLKVDDAVVMQLDSAARIDVVSLTGVRLQSSNGKKLSLAKGHKLRIEVPVGSRFDLTLADGTRVWLNAASSFEYPSTFEGCGERRVKLEGEAFFDVRRDTNCPFYVELGKQETVRVLGTSFNINAYPDAAEHVTTLVSGKVSCHFGTGQESVILSPDQQACFRCQDGITDVRRVDASFYSAWKEGWIWFEQEKLPQLAAKLARLYGIRIEVADKYRDYSFSGKIRFERGVDYITRLLSRTTGIVCQVEDGVIKLK